jgi:hypothetical protein
MHCEEQRTLDETHFPLLASRVDTGSSAMFSFLFEIKLWNLELRAGDGTLDK